MIHLAPDEHIIYTARKHSFVFFTETTFIFIFALLPLIFLAEAKNISINKILTGVTVEPFLWYLYVIWIIILWLMFTYIWTDYYLDMWIVTNKHMIDVDQRGLFNRKISTSRLDLIQDITVQVPSIFATFLGYGDIHMQTAGQSREFILKNVARPYKLKEVIVQEQDAITERRYARLGNAYDNQPPENIKNAPAVTDGGHEENR